MVFYMKIKQEKEDIASIKYGRDQNFEIRLTLEIATRQIRPFFHGVRAQPVSKLLHCKCMIIYFKNLSV